MHPVANPSLNAPLLRSPTHFSPSLLPTGRRPDIVPPPAGHGGTASRGGGGDGAGRRQAAQRHPAGLWRERRPAGGPPDHCHGHNSGTAGGHRRTGSQTAARPSLDGQTSAKVLAWSRQQGHRQVGVCRCVPMTKLRQQLSRERCTLSGLVYKCARLLTPVRPCSCYCNARLRAGASCGQSLRISTYQVRLFGRARNSQWSNLTDVG